METKKPNFLGIENRRSLLIFSTLLGLGFLWYAPLVMSFMEVQDYSVDFIMADASADSGYVKDFGEFPRFEMVLTRYLDTIRIAVITDANQVICVIDNDEVKQLKYMGDGRFFGSIDTSVNDVTVICNGHTLTSRYEDGLKYSKKYGWCCGGIPPMIPY